LLTKAEAKPRAAGANRGRLRLPLAKKKPAERWMGSTLQAGNWKLRSVAPQSSDCQGAFQGKIRP